MTNYIRKMSGKQYFQRIAENPTVIIPTGACEIYGPQLPMGTDLIVAKKIAEMIAERTNSLIAPTIEMGESSALGSFPCTFALPRKVLEDYLDYLVGKLIKDGMKNFLFITGHAGNVETINYICKKYLNIHEIKVAQVDWWRFTNTNSNQIFDHVGKMAHGHASECGTSVMMYLYPELVNVDELTRIEPHIDLQYNNIIVLEKFNTLTPNGTIGDATVASPQKGKEIVDACVKKILSFMDDYF